ncbi:MAG TPA: 50S ribosomal protein L9 [Candidatus Marinimicrobia bacterium]|nr:50S ribosomal protein L9 [Candidatus Neomarinimicrobiota bacterium]
MKILLKEDVDKVGKAGEIINVKDGYGRNFLIPQQLGILATKAAIKMVEDELALKTRKAEAAKRSAEKLASRLNNVSITASVIAGEEDKLFGSVTNQNIADLLKEKGYDIDRHTIMLDEPIKALGVYVIPVKLHPEVKAEVKLWVIKSN